VLTHCLPLQYVKMDWCGENKSIDGHVNFSHALNATGRPMAFELCRGDYEKLPNYGYAPSVAQVWRADGDHHDTFSHTLEQLAAIKGKSNWSKPYGWAYMDMMMTGGQGCSKDGKTPNPDKPTHCPGQV
jgi:alpha-galactosidase